MKFGFILLAILISFHCLADMGKESFFIKGKMYGRDNKPLANKEILVISGKEFCFFATDKSGCFCVEILYSTYISCLRADDSIYKARFDKDAIETANISNGDSLRFYCENEYYTMPQLWYKYYSADNSCRHQDTFSHPILKNIECLTEKMDIHFIKKDDNAHKQRFYKQKIDSVRTYLNNHCDIPADSARALKCFMDHELQELHLGHLEKFNALRNSDTLISLKMKSWEIDDAIRYYITRYQLLNRSIASITNPQLGGLCNRYFKIGKEYFLKNYLSEYNFHYVLKHKNGIITEMYVREK